MLSYYSRSIFWSEHVIVNIYVYLALGLHLKALGQYILLLRKLNVNNLFRNFFQLGADLLPDFFLDSEDLNVEDIKTFKEKKAMKQASGGADELSSLFENVKGYCSEDVVSNTQAVYQFDIIEHGSWFLDLKTGSGNFILFLSNVHFDNTTNIVT